MGVSLRETGTVFQETAAEEEKAREPMVDSLMSGIWKVSVGGWTESVGRGVELKAVGQVGGSRVVDALIAEGSNLVLNSL